MKLTEEEKWLELRRFFDQGGGELLDAYELFDFPITGRGVRAKRAIKKGERLVQVPKSLQITAPWILQNCPMISEFMRKAPRDTQIDAWDLITLFLMFERQVGRESKYAPFIQSMPFFFTNPIAWPEEYFDLFPEQTKRAVMDSLKDAKIRFTRLEKINKNSHLLFDLDWKYFLWSQCCITSRNLDCEYVEAKNQQKFDLLTKMKQKRLGFRSLMKKENKSFFVFNDKGQQTGTIVAPNWMKTGTEHDTSGIAPVFEMFNHAEKNNAFFDFDPINKKLYVAANRDIEHGEQVFINYSDREDDEMLLHYGFAYPPNVNRFSFLEVTKEELKIAVQHVTSHSRGIIDKRLANCRSLKIDFTEMHISKAKLNIHLREACAIALGDSPSTRPKNKLELREMEKRCRLGKNPFDTLSKEQFQLRRRVLDHHGQILEVVRYICQTRVREADDLLDLEERRLRILRPSQHWPLHLAGNIREVHSTIAEEWVKKSREELDKIVKLQELATDIENGNYSDELVPNLANITCSSVAALNVLNDDKRSQSLQSLNQEPGRKMSLNNEYQSFNGPPLKTYGSLADLKKRYDARKKEQPKRLTLAQRFSASCQTLAAGSPKFRTKQFQPNLRPLSSK